MKFNEYISESCIAKKEKYIKLFDEIESIYNKLRDKLKIVPISYSPLYNTITVGLDLFEQENLPYLKVSAANDTFLINQGSNTFDKKALLKYSEILAELYENKDFIEDCLKEYELLKKELHSLK